MYILPNGESISEDNIQSLADERGVSFYEIVNEVGIKELPGSDDNSILEDTGQFFVDKAAALVSATSSLGAGAFNFAEGLIENAVFSYMDASDYFTDDDYTDEDRKVWAKKIEDELVMDSNFTELAEIADSYRTKYDKDMFDSFGEGDYLAGTDQVISGVVGAIPSIAATAYGGWAGLIGLGISEAGATYEELSEAKTDERGLAMFGNALAQGTIEAASEAAMRGTFGVLGKLAGVKTAAKQIGSRIVLGALGEATSETAASEFNNYLDGFYTESKFYDKDGNLDIKNITKRVGETMLISGIVGGGMTSIGELSANRQKLIVSNLTPNNLSNRNVELSELLIQKKALKKGYLKENKNTSTIDKEISEIEAYINHNNNIAQKVVGSYSKEETTQQLEIKGEITDLETTIKNSSANDLVKQELQKELEQKKKEQNEFFTNRLDQLKTEAATARFESSNKEVAKIKEQFKNIKDKNRYLEDAENQLINNKDEVNTKSINDKAEDIYTKEQLSIKYDEATANTKQYISKNYKETLDILEIPDDIKAGTPEFNKVLKEHNDQLDAEYNYFLNDEKNPKKLAKKRKEIRERKAVFKEGLIKGQIEGAFVPGVKGYNNGKSKIIVSKDNSIENGKISTLAHEVLHHEMYLKFGNDASQNEKGESLLNYLSKNEKSIYDQIILRLESSYTKRDADDNLLLDDDGNRVKEDDYYLEAFNAMSDIISFNPEFKKNKTLLNKIKEFINNLLNRDAIKDGEDVFDFITNYNKSVVFGRGNNKSINKSKTPISDKNEKSSRTINSKVDKDKIEELDNRVTLSKLSKSDFPNLLNNTAYKEFQQSLKGITLYHGGNRTIDELKKSKDDNWASWWYAGSPYGSMQYAGMSSELDLESDGFDLNYNQETREPKYKGGKLGPYKKMNPELYKEKYSPRDQMYKLEFDKVKDAIIIPDVEVFEDFSVFLYNEDIKDFQETFKKGSKAKPNDLSLYSYGDVVGILDLPAEKAEAILIQYMDYIKKYDENYIDFFSGNKEGKLDTYDFRNNPVPLTIIGKINSNSIEKIESKEDDFTFIDDVYKEYDKETSTTKFSKTDLVSDINKLVPSSATKDSWKKGDLFDAYSEITEGNLLNALIGSKLEPGDNVYGKPKADIIREIKEEVGLRLMNFDPENEAGLAGYLLGGGKTRGIVDYAALDVIKKYKKEAKIKTTSIDRTFAGKDGDEMSMDIEDTSINETAEERKQREKEIKEVIIGRKGFQGETRKPLKDSITFENKETNSEFKLEVAKVLGTINIPITSQQQDFISKFREELTGRKYFKDSKGKTKQTVSLKDAWTLVRKESGWKNKSDYEAFLLKNKEALLNGLTTTYLSKAFPSAIEKFVVDGVDSNGNVTGNFTTSWNPKAKTGTKPGDIDFIRSVGDVSQLEGDKTGKQRMRRVSNVKESVPDELWIDHFKTGKKSWPQMKSEPMWREIAGEMGYEVLQEEINKLDDYVESLEQITEDPGLNSDQVKAGVDNINNSDEFNIISKLYQNQESMNSFIIDSTVANINKQLERGVTKFSRSKVILEALNEIRALNDFDPKQYTIDNAFDAIVETGYYSDDIIEGLEIALPKSFSQYRGSNKEEKEAGNKIQEVLRSNPDAEIIMKQSLANTKGDFVFFDKNGKRLFAVEHKTKPSDPLGGHTLSPDGKIKMPRAQASAYIRDVLDSEGFQYKFKGGKNDGKVKQTWSSLTNKQKIAVMTTFGDPSEVTNTLTVRKNKVLEEKFKQENKELIDYVEDVIKTPLEDLRIKWVNTYNKIAKSEKLQTIKSISDKNINKDIRRKVENDKSLTKYVLVKDKDLNKKKNRLVSKTYIDQGVKYASYGPKATISPIDINKDLGLDVTVRVVSSGKYIYGRVFYSIPKEQISIAENKIKNKKGKINLTDEGVIQFLSSFKLSKSKENLSETFNKIIEQNENVDASKIFSDSTAKLDGATVGTYKFFVPPSAEDFMGLMYSFLGKGKVGDAQKNFFEETLNGPYKRGISNMESAKQNIENSYTAARKRFPEVVKKLGKKIPGTSYTYDQAIRVHLWKTGAFDQKVLDSIGLSNAEINMLNKTVTDDSRMQQFAREVGKSTGLPEGYIPPSDYWLVDTIASDLSRVVDKVGRKKFLNEFIENKKEIFDKDNLNKIEAVYGSNFREALEDVLKRMETGNNNTSGKNRLVNRYTKWLNNSVGAIMFFNMRSATLQTISAINFMNWSDNNPLMAAKAFANQKQFWEDFVMIFNSDKLKQRRKGLKTDVNTAELASSVADSKNKAKAALNYLLKIGFAPTQLADSFAIAVGGASMYRNRLNTFKKQGMSNEEAQKAAFEDFAAIAEESQQSSDPSLVSQQQSGPLGRFILAFQNTPMQYNRLMKKAIRDLKNRRGDWKTNVSKIVYYGAVQNLIFSTLSNALFAMAFDDEDEDKKQDKIDKKEIRVINNMIDTILRGSGVGGAAVATVKNGIMKYYEQENKEYGKDHAYTILELVNYSPPIGKKLRNVYSAISTNEWEKDVIAEKGFSIDSPIYKVGGSLTSAAFNIPLDRVVNKAHNVSAALDNNNSTIQRILLGLGWNTWDLNIKNEENELIKSNAKDARRKAGYKKAAETRRKKNNVRTIQRRTIQRRTVQ